MTIARKKNSCEICLDGPVDDDSLSALNAKIPPKAAIHTIHFIAPEETFLLAPKGWQNIRTNLAIFRTAATASALTSTPNTSYPSRSRY